MEKYIHTRLLATLFITSVFTAKAQTNARNYFIAHDLDSVGYEWTAMTKDWNGSLVVSTVQESSNGLAFGPLRLRIHRNIGRFQMPQSTTITSPGNFRVVDMHYDGAVWMTGTYKGMSIIGTDTLNSSSANDPRPFIAQFVSSQEIYTWAWHDSLASNSYFQKLRSGSFNQLLASGVSNDSSGWLAAFNASTGEVMWEKKLPGVRTISDARPFPNDTSSFLITGTMPDTGHIFQVPVPLNGAVTGYRNFLARMYPNNDSIVFIHTVPGHAFNFEPVIVQRSGGWLPNYVWSTPIATPNSQGQVQLRWHITSPTLSDTIVHEYFYQEMEEQQYPTDNMALLKTPGIHPNLFDLRSSTGSYVMGQFSFSQGTQPPFLTHLSAAEFSLAFESTGMVQADMIGFHLWRDSTLIFPNASPSQPKWVLLTTGFIPSSVAEKSLVHFTVYPNPAGPEGFHIRTEAPIDQAARWYLRDLQGRLVIEGSLNATTELIPTNGIAAGLYFFELHTQQGSGIQKVVIR